MVSTDQTTDLEGWTEFRVKSTADVKKLADALYVKMMAGAKVYFVCLGAASLAQGVKAITISSQKFAGQGYSIWCKHAFAHLELPEDDPRYETENGKTLMRIFVEKRVG